MAPETMVRAFEPFFTTKSIGQETGFGLSMIHGFAKQSGGHVRIDAEFGHGTSGSTCQGLTTRIREMVAGRA